MILDTDGSLFGSPSTAISNNNIGQNISECTWNGLWNGYLCTRTDFALVSFGDVGPDR